MWKTCQDALHAYSFSNFQLKMRMANLFMSQTKDKTVHRLLQNNIKNNLDVDPGQGVLGGTVATVTKYTKVKSALSKGLSFNHVSNVRF